MKNRFEKFFKVIGERKIMGIKNNYIDKSKFKWVKILVKVFL